MFRQESRRKILPNIKEHTPPFEERFSLYRPEKTCIRN